jgi:hypothetical protein
MMMLDREKRGTGVRGSGIEEGEHPHQSRRRDDKKHVIKTSLFLSTTHLCANRVPNEQGAHKFETVVHRGDFVAAIPFWEKKVKRKKNPSARSTIEKREKRALAALSLGRSALEWFLLLSTSLRACPDAFAPRALPRKGEEKSEGEREKDGEKGLRGRK